MLILKKVGYVPEIFGQGDVSFGDYVSITIDGEGGIKNLKVGERITSSFCQ